MVPQSLQCPKCGNVIQPEPEIVKGGAGTALRAGIWWWASDRTNSRGVMAVEDGREATSSYTFTRIADIPESE